MAAAFAAGAISKCRLAVKHFARIGASKNGGCAAILAICASACSSAIVAFARFVASIALRNFGTSNVYAAGHASKRSRNGDFAAGKRFGMQITLLQSRKAAASAISRTCVRFA
jgi:hypothetical protein